jgi:hypothetical protein
LTPGGRQLISLVFPRHAKAVEKQMSRLEPQEQEALRRICRNLGKGGENQCSERLKKEKEDVSDSTQ